jgi:hypothetical protein
MQQQSCSLGSINFGFPPPTQQQPTACGPFEDVQGWFARGVDALIDSPARCPVGVPGGPAGKREVFGATFTAPPASVGEFQNTVTLQVESATGSQVADGVPLEFFVQGRARVIGSYIAGTAGFFQFAEDQRDVARADVSFLDAQEQLV